MIRIERLRRILALIAAALLAVPSAEGTIFYFNDAFTNGDVYTCGPGNDANPGTNPCFPKLKMTSLVAVTNFVAGDIAYIDTGIYSNETVEITATGFSTNLVTIRGSTNYAAGGTVYRRNSGSADGFFINGGQYVRLTDLRILNARYGVVVAGPNCQFERVYCADNATGFRILSANQSFMRCVAARNEDGVVSFGDDVTWDSGISWSNNSVQFGSTVRTVIRNSVIVGGTVFNQIGTNTSDYNVFWNVDMDVNSTYGTFADFQSGQNGWFHSIVAEPSFANPDGLDFHELSPAGRYVPAVTNFVTTDSVFSVTIDFGDPSSTAWTNEPSPNNGSRLNAGAFGGTGEASKSRTNAWLLAISMNDGGTITKTGKLYWTYGNLATNSKVRFEYSPNLGSNWIAIVTNIPITNAFYTWDASAVTSTAAAYWRVMSEGSTNVFDANDIYFVIKGITNRINFYVNDSSTNGDVYCTTTGKVSNTGLSPSSPKSSLQQIVDAYDLGPGDFVLVDAGTYLTNTTTLLHEDEGLLGAPVTIQGSTNYSTGGTIFDRQNSTSDVIVLSGVLHIKLSDLRVQNGNRGVNFPGSLNLEFSRVTAVSNNTGFTGSGSLTGILFDRCVASRNTQGVVGFAGGWRWQNGLSWSNGTAFTTSGGSTPIIVTNSIIVGGTAFSGLFAGDYNALWNAFAASGFTNFNAFQEAQNNWWHSGVINPQIANGEAVDFHERSQSGRYDPVLKAFVTSDTVTSSVVDFADPAIAVVNEQPPNGARMNAGIFGNTGEASKSRTNAWLQVLTYNDGGTLDVGFDTVYWNAGAYTNGSTVRIEVSRNGGISWLVVATNISVTNGFYLWANTNYLSSELGRWRIMYDGNTNSASASGPANFIFKNGPFSYFVNDSSTNGDVYCSAPGDDGNPGTDGGSPKATLQSLLTSREILPGDFIFVDTGNYDLTSDQTITSLDDGGTNGYVMILGSTNCVAGGTVFNRSSVGIGLNVSGASFLDIRDITVTNGGTGVRVSSSSDIRMTRVAARKNSGSGFDIMGSTNTRLDRAESSRNGNNGIVVSSDSTLAIENSILWRNGNAGLRVDSGRATITNSIVVTSGDGTFAYLASTTTNIIGNYNDIVTQTNALMGFITSLGRNLDTHSSWVGSTTQEVMSLNTDPLFFSPDQNDFHLKTSTRDGRFIPCVGFNPAWDAEDSPCIDAGAPTSIFTNEVQYNGSRVNIGLYGNTAEASKRTNVFLQAASLRAGGWVKGTSTLHWVAGGAVTGHTMRVEFSPDGGNSWNILTSGIPAASEAYVWNTTTTNNTPAGLWRVTSLTNTNIFDATTNFFAIRNGNLTFYINNGSTNGDLYTSAVGSPTNWIASSNKPLNSLASALSVYDVEPTDVILIDNGTYTNNATATLELRDTGASNAVVSILGSTNYAAGGSVIYRGNTSEIGLQIAGVRWIVVSNLTFRGGNTGVQIADSFNVSFGDVRSIGNSSNGFAVLTSSNLLFQRIASQDNGGFGIFNQSAHQVRCLHSVFFSNAVGAVRQTAGEMGISNSVLTASGAGRFVYVLQSNAMVRADYNNVRATNDAFVALDGNITSRKLSRWRDTRTNDLHSLSHDPRFANAAVQDFHVLSPVGRLNPQTGSFVTTDAVFSVMIDAGDPLTTFTNEFQPNGSRVNVGYYGNHPQESKTPSNGWFVCLTLNDGGSIRGTGVLYWVAGGVATGHATKIDYSANAGVTWSNIASNIPASVGSVIWTTTLYQSSAQGKWRIVSLVTNIFDESGESNEYFSVDNGPLTNYVNDASTNGDVYTSQPGSLANDGTAEDSPLPSISEALRRYEHKAGDVILVDSGTYDTFEQIEIDDSILGQDTNRFVIRGSTNRMVGGTILDVTNGDVGIFINGTVGITLTDLKIINAKKGVTIQNSTNIAVSWVGVDNAGIGMEVSRSAAIIYSNCAVSRANTAGVYNLSSTGVIWQSGVLWSNSTGVRVGQSPIQSSPAAHLTFSNSVISAYGSGSLAYRIDAGTLVADYNNIFLTNGAYAATEGAQLFSTIYDTVSRWVRGTGRDVHSLTHEPGFANQQNGDFHLKTTVVSGRFDAVLGVYTNDAVTSPLIDAGHPGAALNNEPAPNGARVDIGLYGNTTESSKTPTNSVFTAVSINDGGRADGTNVLLYWVNHGNATAHTVRLEYSVNSGTNWTTIVTGLPATNQSYIWNSTAFTSSLTAKWRVLSLTDQAISDPSDYAFMLRNTNYSFYVNDNSTNNDMYSTAVGSANNQGLASNAPMNSIQTILDTYDLEPGDTIYTDTGVYTGEQGRVLVSQLDAGRSGETNMMVIRGSTNLAAGGTVLNRQGGDVGITIQSASAVEVRDMSITGVSTSGVSISQGLNNHVVGIRTRDGMYGFEIESSIDSAFDQCVVIGATHEGILNNSGSNTTWQSGVLWSNNSAAVSTFVQGSFIGQLTIANSVIGMFGAGKYAYLINVGNIQGDYNDFYLVGGARVALRDSTIYDTVTSWVLGTGQDSHSLTHDPGFYSTATEDFHLKSTAVSGRFDAVLGVWTNDGDTSRLIDAGNTNSAFGNEPQPNGSRINIGLYGNTIEASRTPTTTGSLTVISFNDGGNAIGNSVPLRWVATGVATGHTLEIVFSWDAGETWEVLTSGVAAASGQYIWDSTLYTSTVEAIWGLYSLQNTNILDFSDKLFAVRNTSIVFFVNNVFTNGDVYTTAPGSAANKGLKASAPKHSIQAIIDTWDLQPGDVIYVDTGVYSNNFDTVIEQLDAGIGTNNNGKVVILGSTNGVAGGTVIDRLGGAAAFSINGAEGIELRNLSIRGAQTGVNAVNSLGCVFYRVDVVGGNAGFQVSQSANASFSRCSVRGANQGLSCSSAGIVWQNGVLWSNLTAANVSGGSLAFSHSIVGAFGSNAIAFTLPAKVLSSDYNDYFLTNGARFATVAQVPQPIVFYTVSRWVHDTGSDVHSLTHDPGFANPSAGDFHLKSTVVSGRFDAVLGVWTNDVTSSVLIDAGNPQAVFENEPEPNGGRVNIDMFGSTNQASRTPTNAVLTTISLNDGGLAEGAVTLTWLARGAVTSHMTRLEYSSDAGATWVNIASNVVASAGIYVWDSLSYTSSIRGYWKITSQDNSNVFDQTDYLFALRNNRLSFFVNDLFTNGDMYCSAAGSSANHGTLPSSPKASVQEVLATWDLEPGDTIFVDTGIFELTNDTITIDRFDTWNNTNLLPLAAGLATNRVTIQGSTNEMAGGTVITKGGGGNIVEFSSAPGVALRNLTLRGGSSSFSADDSPYGFTEWVRCENGGRGFDINNSDFFEMVHCVARGFSGVDGRGLSVVGSDGVFWHNGVLWSNTFGVYHVRQPPAADSLTVENSIFGVFGSNSYAHLQVSGTLLSDYNNIFLTNGGFAGGTIVGGFIGGATQRYESVFFWQRATGEDLHTLSENPKFANVAAGDFHLKTTRPEGRFDPALGVWTNDTEFSRLIDAGKKASSFNQEPSPNGSRVNIGQYGNSPQASKTPTNSWFTTITLNDGGTVQDFFTLRWVSGGSATGNTIYIDFSPVAGTVWTNIAAGVSAEDEEIIWDSCPYGRSLAGLWRIVSVQNGTVASTSRVFFVLRPGICGENPGQIPFFVNDPSTNGDVYTTGAGSPNNQGIDPAAPIDSIQTILDTYKLEPFDIIYVDTGVYTLPAEVLVQDLDAGFGSNRVTIQGSTNFAAGGTILDRLGGSAAIHLEGTAGFDLRHLTLRNATAGLFIDHARDSLIYNVRSEENGFTGFSLSESTVDILFSNCVSRNNGGLAGGFGLFNSKSSYEWVNGTIWGNGGGVGNSLGGPHSFRNSLLQASGVGRRIFNFEAATPVTTLESDYNNLIREDGAQLAEIQVAQGGNELFGYMYDWQTIQSKDLHSLSHAPQLVDASGGDFHLRSQNGRYQPDGTLTNDSVTSPMIDTADPAFTYTNEPDPDGGRLNIGNYGNTPSSSLSLTNPWLLAISLNDGGVVRGTVTLWWASGNLPSNELLRLDFTRNGGVDWQLIASNVLNSSAPYMWNLSQEPFAAQTKWRVVRQNFTNLYDESDTFFTIKNNPLTIYINDASQDGDMYCSAVGAPDNSGLSNNVPMNDPAAALIRYPTMGPGDIMFVDTGIYMTSNDMVLGELNRGVSNAPILLQGSTNQFAGGSVINRGTNGGIGLQISNTRYVNADHLTFTRGNNGFTIGNSIDCTFSWVNTRNVAQDGMVVNKTTPMNLVHCASYNNGGFGINANGGAVVIIRNGVLWSNAMGGALSSAASINIEDSIVHSTKTNSYLYKISAGSIAGNYNILWAEPNAKLMRDDFRQLEYRNLYSWQKDQNSDYFSVLVNPLMYNPIGGDFHLRSTAGRYFNGSFTNDADTSWAIDAGNPAHIFTNEPNPRGVRINAGEFGNTGQESKSVTNPAEKALLVASLNDGGTVRDTVPLYWLSRAMTPSDKVTIEVSINSGQTWNVIATGISATAVGYQWDSTTITSTPLALWGVRYEGNTNIADMVDRTFIIRNTPFTFYVNDAITNGDVYTKAPGDCANFGLEPESPKASIQCVVESYDLEGGDRVFVDTGLYPVSETNKLFLDTFVSGVLTAKVDFIASTNRLAGGTVLQGTGSNSVLHMSFVSHVAFDNFIIQNGDVGIFLDQNNNFNIISNVLIRDCSSYGISLFQSIDNQIVRSVITRSGVSALLGSITFNNTLDSCVLWNSANDSISLTVSTLNISNSTLYASGENNACISLGTNATVKSDYNNFYVTNNGLYGLYRAIPVEGLPEWVAATTQDVHSLAADPLFFKPDIDDYHLRSPIGRYSPTNAAYVTIDTNFSYLIDIADPASAFTNETQPNGGRRDIGIYGDTTESSKSRTNEWLLAITGNAGGLMEGSFQLVWAYGGGIAPTNLMRLDYSIDAGVTWSNISTSQVGAMSFQWVSDQKVIIGVTTNERWITSPIAKWRIMSINNTNLYDETDLTFTLRNKPILYYMNDTNSQAGDIYASVLGNDNNLGFMSNSPMATLRAMVAKFNLEGGDPILIDSGIYPITTNDFTVVGLADAGKPGKHIVITGNTNAMLTVMDRASQGVSANIMSFGAQFITVQNMILLGGNIFAANGNTIMRNLIFTNGSIFASGSTQTIEDVRMTVGNISASVTPGTISRVTIDNGAVVISGTNILLRNTLVYGGSVPAVQVAGANIVLRNNTLASGGTQFKQTAGNSTLENNILVASGVDNFCIQRDGGIVVSDYNNLVARSGAWIGNQNGNWEKLLYWQRESNNDKNSLSHEPLFANEGAGDYHVKSIAGRFTPPSGFTNDAVHSPSIDAANPATVVVDETTPNGGRVNQGAYGNTVEASRSRTNAWLLAVTMNDGGVLKGTNTIRWLSGNIDCTNSLFLQYSPNSGSSWSNIATVVACTNQYLWDTTLFPSSLDALWRVVLVSNTGVFDQIDQTFALRNVPLNFYVNDSSTNRDIYTSVAGNAGFNGRATNTPKDSLVNILAAYDVEGGDTIYVDTGTYSPGLDAVIIWSRGGDAEYGPVVIQGSTNVAFGGSAIARNNTLTGNDAIDVKASYVTLRDLTVRGAYRGIFIDSNRIVKVERVLAVSNEFGLVAARSINPIVRNTRFWNNRQGGIDVLSSPTTIVENCTFYGNVPFSSRSVASPNSILQNNIFGLATTSTNPVTALVGSTNNMLIDYNVYYFASTNVFIFGDFNNLLSWQLNTTNDYRSAITNPLMANAAGGDFHEMSTVGRFVDGSGFTQDTQNSWAIDRGNPKSLFTNEPAFNANRVNIGAYGNTIFASKSRTNQILEARQLNDPTFITNTNGLWPLIWSAINLPSNMAVNVQYSGDGGATWINLQTNINILEEVYFWQTSPFYNTYKGFWRVIGVTNAAIADANNANFDLFYGDFRISDQYRSENDLNTIIWRGAWDETYQVQYSESMIAGQTNKMAWTNAPTGIGTNRQANFISTFGGDMMYEDIGSIGPTGRYHRLYRVVWEQYEP